MLLKLLILEEYAHRKADAREFSLLHIIIEGFVDEI